MRKIFAALALAFGFYGFTLALGPLAAAANGSQLSADQGLFFALATKDIPTMAALRDQGADPNATLARLGLAPQDIFAYRPPLEIFNRPFNTAGWPILTWAVYLDNPEALRLLLRAGARVGGVDEYGATALHWAAWAGRHSLAQQLLNNGASCQAKDFKGRTPKDWAVMTSQTDLIRLLDSRSCRNAAVGDEDQDGVADNLDLCPGTPLGAQVDESGCWIAAYATFFDLDRAVIKNQFLPYIRQTAQVLVNSPDINVNLVGHTDSSGTDEYNLDLGLRRAEAIRRELIRQGVDPNRLSVTTQGESAPIADNVTYAGRAKNRRVEIHVAQPGAVANLPESEPLIVDPLLQ
ncbi:MAG: OmpA family protein [Deltaproteobacteria bacterium]|jgi:outer membrane protein OmpA-like peptidoglycan-associated protein|nr:OmpA family protein [Deltaproteobacteria bacterium]